MHKLTVELTELRYYSDDCHDGDYPAGTIDNAITKVVLCNSWSDAVHLLREHGLTEWSNSPALFSEHGWYSNPDGGQTVYGGDQYDPGYDTEEFSAHVTGKGAYRLFLEITTKNDTMYHRSSDPVLGGSIADGWDGGNPWGSGMSAMFAVLAVLDALDEDIPADYGYRRSAIAQPTIEELAENTEEDYLTADIASDVLNETVTVDDLQHAARVLNRYLDILPESVRY